MIQAERPFDPTLKSGQIHYYDLNEMINLESVQLLVAEIDESVVASGYARIEQAKIYNQHKSYAYLGFMYTRPEYRGRGINKEIISALKSWAASKSVYELRLEVYFGNEAAIKAYEKCGFENYLLEMRCGL